MLRLPATVSLVWLLATGGAALAQDGLEEDPLLDTGAEADASADVDATGEAGASGEMGASAEVAGGADLGEGGGAGGGFGVGIQAMLGGPFGAAVLYDPGAFHIEGILGFYSNGETVLSVGGRFYYHLHTSTAADFSLGGGLGILTDDDEGPGDSATVVSIEAGAQLRTFVVPNVALSASLGLAIFTGDVDLVTLTGQLVGAVGLSYYF